MKKNRRNKSVKTNTKISLLVLVVLLLFTGAIAYGVNKEMPAVEEQETTENINQPEPEQPNDEEVVATTPTSTIAPKLEPPKWPVTYSLNEASSLIVVVNKKYKLPSNYVPSLNSVAGGQLRPEAASALSSMLVDAQNNGVPMKIISSYRSYDTQVATYNRWVKLDGQVQADRSSARPGHSEHQTGLAVDLGMPDGSCDLEICFGDTQQGKWLEANSHKYGFIVRYENDTEAITGYQYEPWHMRYVGVDVATAVVASGETLDQYYGVEAGGY